MLGYLLSKMAAFSQKKKKKDYNILQELANKSFKCLSHCNDGMSMGVHVVKEIMRAREELLPASSQPAGLLLPFDSNQYPKLIACQDCIQAHTHTPPPPSNHSVQSIEVES